MEKLCREIGMPKAVTQRLLALHTDAGFAPDVEKLMHEETWNDGLSALKKELGADPDGMKLLCCMLRCALAAWEHYRRLGFSRRIYIDTMACFSRFVREHLESFGCYGFDRGFWTVRQVSCKLFRIGELEYELAECENVPQLRLHIPSDAHLERALLHESVVRAKALIGKCFPAYENAPMCCCSWLLSPTLKSLLPAQSRILEFQKSFCITPLCGGDSYRQWVYRDPNLAIEDFPENTALQRSLKAYLLNGGVFIEAEGTLLQNPFQ